MQLTPRNRKLRLMPSPLPSRLRLRKRYVGLGLTSLVAGVLGLAGGGLLRSSILGSQPAAFLSPQQDFPPLDNWPPAVPVESDFDTYRATDDWSDYSTYTDPAEDWGEPVQPVYLAPEVPVEEFPSEMSPDLPPEALEVDSVDLEQDLSDSDHELLTPLPVSDPEDVSSSDPDVSDDTFSVKPVLSESQPQASDTGAGEKLAPPAALPLEDSLSQPSL